MAKPYHVDVWTDRPASEGGPQKKNYAAMAESVEEARTLVQAALPPGWRFDVPDNWPPYGLAVIREFDLKPGDVTWIG